MNARKITLIIIFMVLLAIPTYAFSLPKDYSNSVALYIPAVEKTDEGYRGVLATLTVIIKPGNDRVFVDTLPLTEIDTQAGARVAKEAVEDILGINLNNYDLFYIIRSDSPIVGGPSAGGAMAVGTLAAVLNLSIDKSVVMTGTINPDGTIGPVGGLVEKAEAVASHNGTMFLIPEGQSVIQIQETKTKRFPFGVQIVSQPITINLKDYANEKWNLTVEEISNIKEALKYFTGYEIKTGEITVTSNDKLKNVMKRIADEMMNDTIDKYDEIGDELKSSKIPYEYEVELNNLYSKQKDSINKMSEYYKNKNFYSAASTAFSTMIQLDTINYTILFLESNKPDPFLYSQISTMEDEIKKTESEIKNDEANIDNISDIEIIAIASERISDAKNNIKEAWKNYYNDKYTDAINYLSYAVERKNTAMEWLSLIHEFNGERLNVSTRDFKELASLRIGEALSLITYAQLLKVDTTKAEERIQLARESFDNENYLSALFNAITAKAEVDFLLKVNGLSEDEIKNRLSYFKREAKRDIAEAQEHGCLPILAFNYYEYANALEKTDPIGAAVFYTYARHFAKTSKNLAEVFQGRKFKNLESAITIKPVSKSVKCKEDLYTIGVIFLIGVAIGSLFKKI